MLRKLIIVIGLVIGVVPPGFGSDAKLTSLPISRVGHQTLIRGVFVSASAPKKRTCNSFQVTLASYFGPRPAPQGQSCQSQSGLYCTNCDGNCSLRNQRPNGVPDECSNGCNAYECQDTQQNSCCENCNQTCGFCSDCPTAESCPLR